MTSIVYAGERAKEIASSLKADHLINAKDEDLYEGDVLGFVAEVRGSSLPLSLENYVKNVVSYSDNKDLGYIFAILITDKSPDWAANRLSEILSNAGCVLSYVNSYSASTIEKIKEDIKKEEFKIAKNGLLYRLLRRSIKPYED